MRAKGFPPVHKIHQPQHKTILPSARPTTSRPSSFCLSRSSIGPISFCGHVVLRLSSCFPSSRTPKLTIVTHDADENTHDTLQITRLHARASPPSIFFKQFGACWQQQNKKLPFEPVRVESSRAPPQAVTRHKQKKQKKNGSRPRAPHGMNAVVSFADRRKNTAGCGTSSTQKDGT